MARRPANRRGSTILIVLALLSVLMLLAIMLMYTSKLERISSENFAQSVQTTTSAITGLDKAAREAMDRLPIGDPVGTGTLAFIDPSPKAAGNLVVSAKPVAPARIKGLPAVGEPGIRTATSHVVFSDLSGRLNLNTADRDSMVRLFDVVAASIGEFVDSAALADAIIARRLGADGGAGTAATDDNASAGRSLDALASTSTGAASGECPPLLTRLPYSTATLDRASDNSDRVARLCGIAPIARAQADDRLRFGIDEADEYVSDVRYPPFGDDARVGTLAELLAISSVTETFVAALAPFATTFSVSVETRPSVSDNLSRLSLVDINRACVDEILDVLLDQYGDTKEEDLLRQFAANIVDWRDEDRRPTVIGSKDGLTSIIGLERTPYITEVYPDASDTTGADNGEYIEIYNPWPEEFNIQGWTIEVSSSAQSRTALTGVLRPGATLIVTDDIDDSDSNGFSFFDQFRIVENGVSRRMLANSQLQIPNSGLVAIRLLDRQGNLVDEFAYRRPADTSVLSSFQRGNPLVREASVARATPFAQLAAPPPDAETAERLRYYPADAPFTSELELFNVFAGFATDAGRRGSRWGFPALVGPTSAAPADATLANDPFAMDARMVDLFVVEAIERPVFSANTLPGHGGGYAAGDSETLAWYKLYGAPIGQRRGLININTASAPVFYAMGFEQSAVGVLMQRRAAAESANADAVAYRLRSEILVDRDIWPSFGAGQECQRLAAMAPLFAQLTTTSSAFLLEGTPLQPPNTAASTTLFPRIQAQYAFDQATPDLVFWRFLP